MMAAAPARYGLSAPVPTRSRSMRASDDRLDLFLFAFDTRPRRGHLVWGTRSMHDLQRYREFVGRAAGPAPLCSSARPSSTPNGSVTIATASAVSRGRMHIGGRTGASSARLPPEDAGRRTLPSARQRTRGL